MREQANQKRKGNVEERKTKLIAWAYGTRTHLFSSSSRPCRRRRLRFHCIQVYKRPNAMGNIYSVLILSSQAHSSAVCADCQPSTSASRTRGRERDSEKTKRERAGDCVFVEPYAFPFSLPSILGSHCRPSVCVQSAKYDASTGTISTECVWHR